MAVSTGMAPAGSFLCPHCCGTRQDGSYHDVSEFNYEVDLSGERFEAFNESLQEHFAFSLPKFFPSEAEFETEPMYDTLFTIRKPKDPEEVQETREFDLKKDTQTFRDIAIKFNNRTNISYSRVKCPDCEATLDIPDFGRIPAIYIGNLGSTSCGKTSLYEAMKDLASQGDYAGFEIEFVAWTRDGRDQRLEDTSTELVQATKGEPNYRYIFKFQKPGSERKIMLIYRDFPGEQLGKNAREWAPWLKHMNVLMISIDPLQIKGVEQLLASLEPKDFDEKWKSAFGDSKLVKIDVTKENQKLRAFLASCLLTQALTGKKQDCS